jgi:predicted metalloprotease with PDZ domain
MKTYKGLGLHLSTNGTISYIEPMSPAYVAGLKKGAKIIEINDVVVKDMQLQEIAKVIKENINNLLIGVQLSDSKSLNQSFVDHEEAEVESEVGIETETKIYQNETYYENTTKNSPILASSSSIKTEKQEG